MGLAQGTKPKGKKNKVRQVSDVYSDLSFSDDSDVDVQDNNQNTQQYTGILNIGDYVLVRLNGGHGSSYVYLYRVRDVQEPLLEVQGLKS